MPNGSPSGFSQSQSQQSSNSSGQMPTQYSLGAAQLYPGVSSAQLSLSVPGTGYTYEGGSANAAEYGQQQPPVATVQTMFDQLVAESQVDPSVIPNLQDSLILAGYLDPRSRSYTPGAMNAGDVTWTAYRNLLLDAVRTKTAPDQLLQTNQQNGVGAAKFNLTTNTQSTNISDPQTARHYLTTIMQGELGRKPMNSEIAQFAQSLAETQQSNPNNTTTTYDIKDYLNKNGAGTGAGINPRSSVTSGGSDPSVVAENQIYQNNGQELAQTNATQLMDLFVNMLNGSGEIR